MPWELDFTEMGIAECSGQWKSEDEIWEDPTRAMCHELKFRPGEIVEAALRPSVSKDVLAVYRRRCGDAPANDLQARDRSALRSL